MAIGVSCGSPLDSEKGMILSPPNLPGWDNVPITAWLSRRYRAPAFLENDAKACALAEWRFGAGQGCRSMVFLTFGTGFGAGLFLDGRLYRGKTGVARMALEANVPIIPCAMIDTDKAQPTGQRIPNVVQVGVRIGRPMHYPQYAGQTENHEALREITDDVMRELQRLSGQDYVDEYASTVKKRLAERARGGLEQARENIEQARENIEQARDRARAGLTEAADRAREGLAARRARHDDEHPPT